MKRSMASVLVVGCLLVGATTAEAITTLTTGSAYRFGTFFDCFIVNVGTTPIKVTIQAVDVAGNVDGQLLNQTVLGGDAASLELSSGTGSAALYCKFILTIGNKAFVRASYCVEEPPATARCTATGDAR